MANPHAALLDNTPAIILNISDIKALNKSEYPLEELYQGWMDEDSGIHQALESSVENTIDSLKKEQKSKNKSMER